MVVVLYLIYQALGATHVLRIAIVLAALSMAAAVPAWLIGRELYGDRAGRIAALLFVAAPGPLILAYTSVDAIYATVLTTSAALFVVAVTRRSPVFAMAGGAVLGVGAYLTYAVVFIALAVAVATIVQVRTPRVVGTLLGGAALGGGAVLVLERFVLGFDLLGSYAAIPPTGRRYDPYWIVGHPGAVLILAGLPLACFGVVGLVRKAPDGRFSLLPVTLVALMVIWGALPSTITHLRPGEVERTWAFLYPMLAACAGPLVDRWTRGRRRPWLWLVLLVIISVVQATVVKLLWVTMV
jgi:hypothetical protein